MADPSAQEQQPPAEAAEVPEVAAKPQDGPQEPAPAEQEPEPQQEQQQNAAAAPAAEGAATPAAQEDPAPQQQEQQQEKPSEPQPAYPQPPPEGAAPNGAPSAAAAAAGAPKRTAEQAGLGGGADEDARPSKSLRLDGFDPAVRAKLTALVDGRVLTAADVEGSTSDTLLKLDPASGLELLDALAAAGLAGAADGPARRAMVVVTVARFAQRVKPQMDPVVKAKLEALYTTGGGPVKPGDLDERCIERLREIAPTTAAAVLDTFANKK
ncbi:hypothetical protein MNEG_15392 [Monoraphidium neglectum]|uniref:Heterogeneous nuclear ribonucleoprotein Q acidic domain-containing protein n=1 Tax=Monoraphidium neglectum TaxID=145388 RepID=A0A0D2LRR4_9CHLO|nr:hypothetical protein MNEG_15392 [Monoraphidium neglectum]KIY92571.1 hypothetical protein MNEG_15392 [Monoraphidium neglectum]|eukprot:XP_013891591.1 hypothetical protein MNEG_15392 [Monoraphidium neglectum]